MVILASPGIAKLIQANGGVNAERLRGANGEEHSLLPSAEVPVASWNGDAAVRALGRAYLAVFDELVEGLAGQDD